jgi:hypothetical protein
MATRPVEFIVCGEHENWWTAIREIPESITLHHDIVEYALPEHFNDCHGVVYVGVYNEAPEMPDDYGPEEYE